MCNHAYLTIDGEQKFHRIGAHTCANRASIISTQQYTPYFHVFGLKPSIKPSAGRTGRGIGRRKPTIGTALIKIPFRDILLLIYVELLLLENEVPTLLYMSYMVMNGIDISIQRADIMYGRGTETFKFKNYFRAHGWKPSDIPFALYT